MTENDELHTCPFCGGNAVLRGTKRIRVVCLACRASGPAYNLKSQAIKSWNSRAETKGEKENDDS